AVKTAAGPPRAACRPTLPCLKRTCCLPMAAMTIKSSAIVTAYLQQPVHPSVWFTPAPTAQAPALETPVVPATPAVPATPVARVTPAARVIPAAPATAQVVMRHAVKACGFHRAVSPVTVWTVKELPPVLT